MVFSNVGSNVLNFIYAHKYCKFHFVINKQFIKHLKPIIIIFSTVLATTIYSNLDTTMLGWMLGDKEVGIYSVATKLYNILKSMLNSIVVVFSARLLYLIRNDRREYERLFQYAYDIIAFFTIPIAIGFMCFSAQIIDIISGNEYQAASSVMSIITCSLFFACVGNLLSTGALLAVNKEKLMFIATGIGAILNIVLNAIMIPIWGSAGAAMATLITEIIIFNVLFASFRKNVNVHLRIGHTANCFLATLPFWVIKYIYNVLGGNQWWQSIIGMAACVVLYIVVLFLLRDKFLYEIFKSVHGKMRSKWEV